MNQRKVYRLLAAVLDPLLRAEGFERVPSELLAWHTRLGERYLVLWCQESVQAWTPETGGRFTTELQLAEEPGPGSETGFRLRLGQRLLGTAALEQARRLRTSIMGAAGAPEIDYDSDHEFWFRYRSDADVVEWAQFLVEHLGAALQEFRTQEIANARLPAHLRQAPGDPLLGHDVVRAQRALCDRYGVPWVATPSHLNVGAALNLKTPLQPVCGMRHRPTEGTSGWFLWAGESSPEEQPDDFYSPLHGGHLVEWRPQIIPFLGFAPGWAFVTDGSYTDVWHDPNLLED